MDSSPARASETAAISRARSSTAGDAGSRAPADAASGVRITESARQLAALEAAVKRLPQVDEARVAKIRKAIEDGSYTIDAEATATKLLVFEHDLDSLARNVR
ncbi:MAG: flagellar biosynthesis anti-sigma factor FlgM [Steroidobacteraceae bacterium]